MSWDLVSLLSPVPRSVYMVSMLTSKRTSPTRVHEILAQNKLMRQLQNWLSITHVTSQRPDRLIRLYDISKSAWLYRSLRTLKEERGETNKVWQLLREWVYFKLGSQNSHEKTNLIPRNSISSSFFQCQNCLGEYKHFKQRRQHTATVNFWRKWLPEAVSWNLAKNNAQRLLWVSVKYWLNEQKTILLPVNFLLCDRVLWWWLLLFRDRVFPHLQPQTASPPETSQNPSQRLAMQGSSVTEIS